METHFDTSSRAPILILGLGNVLLGDDGIGPSLLGHISEIYRDFPEVECIDGGTQGLALLGYLSGRRAVVILDAFSQGKKPGAVAVLDKAEIFAHSNSRASTAHEGNAGELLAVANLLGDLPERVFLVGVEPERLRTELGLSPSVRAALPPATVCARAVIEGILTEIGLTPLTLSA